MQPFSDRDFARSRAVKKAQQVGVKVKELQDELQDTEIEAVAAEGGVTVVISGAQVPISVEVTEELLDWTGDHLFTNYRDMYIALRQVRVLVGVLVLVVGALRPR